MTETDIMEELSKGYLEVIANRSGFFNSIHRDYGTDLSIRKAKLCQNRRRYLTTGKAIDIQVKAVSERYVNYLNDPSRDNIKYKLEVKNYNDLIDRANEKGAFIPLILAVFVMPENKDEWIHLTPKELLIRKCAFWYQIPTGQIHSTNENTVTIDIPKVNRIGLDFYNNQFAALD
ncbi:DUF4365 domain-containing protein [Marinigracilibium pacificum]|uniref:DUF4365 domain-containing protein n=1 Tax=Marinigracilibium pacificum TaxID=2729599 RepID=A0A848IXA1_9BACT|nr:DUF4365 domain-containing protein [Marinigracilibium pacificum]NMM47931.1 DUF4365 domain-containing protein [Marinigracilibium pacificum]